jgi:glutathione S-transferase
MGDALPTLWHIPVSHYGEKARWALAWKGVEHRRHSPQPPFHMAVALWLTRGRHHTFPVLSIDGRGIGDSTAIVAELERRYPEPPLYPADPPERGRALELEDFFDEELGPDIRLLAWHELGNDRERFEELMARALPRPLTKLSGPMAVYARTYTGLRFGVRDPRAAERARARILAALDRLEAELGDGEYLVGTRFSVADLTAASLFYPLVQPEGGPIPPEQRPGAGFERFREPLQERRGFQWVAEMFRRHRKSAKAAPAASAAPST